MDGGTTWGPISGPSTDVTALDFINPVTAFGISFAGILRTDNTGDTWVAVPSGAVSGLNDIAFSGDGEPSVYPHLDQAMQIAALQHREVSRAQRADFETAIALRQFVGYNGATLAASDAELEAFTTTIARGALRKAWLLEEGTAP